MSVLSSYSVLATDIVGWATISLEFPWKRMQNCTLDEFVEITSLMQCTPSITDGVHRNKNFVEIIPVFSTFSNFLKKKKKKKY